MKKLRITTEGYKTIGVTKKSKLKVKNVRPHKDDIKMAIVGDGAVLTGRAISVEEAEDKLYPRPIALCRKIVRRVKKR